MSGLLAEVVRVTARAPDSDALLDGVAKLLARHADWVIADRLDDPDLITRVAAYGGDGPLELPAGMGAASSRRSGAGSVGLLPNLLAAPQRLLRLDKTTLTALSQSTDARVALQTSTALGLGIRELLVVGLVSRDVLVGVLTLGSRAGFATEDVTEILDVGQHVALALDAARLVAVQRAVATAMQTSLLPPVPAVAGLRLAARYVPAVRGFDVGGDWYDAFETEHDLVAVIGDATGHDIGAAARMADLRNLLRAHAVDRDEPPSQLLSRLERTAERLGLRASATCTVCRLRRTGEGWRLVWSSAGHLPAVLVHDGNAELLDSTPELMLGVEVGTVRTDQVRDLVAGDLVLLYTDGLVEVRGDDLQHGLDRLREAVAERAVEQPDELVEHLLHDFAAAAGDDVAVLALQVL